jgi:hypothetical protein
LEQNNRKLISLHNNGEGDKHARAAHASRWLVVESDSLHFVNFRCVSTNVCLINS